MSGQTAKSLEENGKFGWKLRDPASHLMTFSTTSYPIEFDGNNLYVEISGVRYKAVSTNEIRKYELVPCSK
ncbi:MAG: hypothetical protein HY831_04210 [Candidatus Aenigmarchaeota archaeon]|nr:hypothetical protein [Candidatus Aenigmarchaeota archaeon]